MVHLSNITIVDSGSPAEPVTLPEVKDWLSVDFADFDALLSSMRKGARLAIQGYCNLALVTSDVTLDAQISSLDEIYLPYAIAITGFIIKRIKSDGSEEDVEASTYYVRKNVVKGLSEGLYYITYTTVNTIPEDLKEAIKMEVSDRYLNRGENMVVRGSAEAGTGLSESAKAKANPYVIPWL